MYCRLISKNQPLLTLSSSPHILEQNFYLILLTYHHQTCVIYIVFNYFPKHTVINPHVTAANCYTQQKQTLFTVMNYLH